MMRNLRHRDVTSFAQNGTDYLTAEWQFEPPTLTITCSYLVNYTPHLPWESLREDERTRMGTMLAG